MVKLCQGWKQDGNNVQFQQNVKLSAPPPAHNRESRGGQGHQIQKSKNSTHTHTATEAKRFETAHALYSLPTNKNQRA